MSFISARSHSSRQSNNIKYNHYIAIIVNYFTQYQI